MVPVRALPLLSAVLCLALAGCGVGSSPPVNPAPASPAAPLATATPATGARVSLLELCASVKARQQNAGQTALADALLGAATDDLAPYLKSGCLAGEVKADLGLLALRLTNNRAILWRQGDKWQAAELEALADRPQILSQGLDRQLRHPFKLPVALAAEGRRLQPGGGAAGPDRPFP